MPKMTLLCGLPGCGKSTWAKAEAARTGAVIHSSDALRQELYGNEDEQAHNPEVFREMNRRTREDLRAGRSVIYDATNLNSRKRIAFLRELGDISCEKVCCILAVPPEICMENNRRRERVVPDASIRRMHRCWNTPAYFEGWDRIELIFPFPEYEKCLGTPEMVQAGLNSFSQENPHHTLTLGDHMRRTWEILCGRAEERSGGITDSLRIAARIHDLGKPDTKGFLNTKGERTEEAHYYQHENAGAYDALFLDVPDPLAVSVLVNLHMKPYCWEGQPSGESTRKRYRDLWGEKLFEDVMLLHEADRAAH